MSENINLAETHVQLKSTELDRLYRAMMVNPGNVYFARKVDDPHPWKSLLLLVKPYCRASDPMETSVCPICGYSMSYERMHLAMNGNTGEIIMRKGKMTQIGGWKPPIIDNQLFAFIPKEMY